jgi:RimJ/RimL family protein N-acetyltransferase
MSTRAVLQPVCLSSHDAREGRVSEVASIIRIRKAVLGDSDAILTWRNHQETRKYFFNPELIDAESHRIWFSASLGNPDRHMLVAEDQNGHEIGIVRFDVQEKLAVVDIYLIPERRKQGLGVPMLKAAVRWLQENTDVKQVMAEVVPANQSSLRMFAAAGFETAAHRLTFDLNK